MVQRQGDRCGRMTGYSEATQFRRRIPPVVLLFAWLGRADLRRMSYPAVDLRSYIISGNQCINPVASIPTWTEPGGPLSAPNCDVRFMPMNWLILRRCAKAC